VRLEAIGKPFDVEPIHVAKHPVTYRQYRAFLDDPEGYRNPAWWTDLPGQKKPGEPRWPVGNRPAERVSWYDAMAYARWLSARLGYEVRLPSEWEWQHAATGGKPDREYPWGKEWDAARANTHESGLGQTTAVGMYPQGAHGWVPSIWPAMSGNGA
jgi:formylglycine-generating enzyme required for sulfatase activity